MSIWGKYNQSKTVKFSLVAPDGIDLIIAATFAAGDIKISLDEGVEVNTTNLPTDEGTGYSLVLTAAEMSAARISLYIIDQTATKIWLDIAVELESYGHASAEHAFDLDTNSVAQTADHAAGIADVPTVAEFNARTLVAASYALASVVTEARLAELDAANLPADIANVPTLSEFNARTIISANYALEATVAALNDFNPATDTVALVTSLTNLPSIPTNWLTAAGIAASAMNGKGDWNVGKTGYSVSALAANVVTAASIAATALNGKGDWNIGKTGYSLTQSFPANFASMVISGGGAVDSLLQGILNTLITEVTAGRIAGNFGVFYRNADVLTTKTVDDVGAGGGGGGTDWSASERNEIRGRLGITGTTAVGGNTPTLALQSAIAALNDLSAAQVNSECDTAILDSGIKAETALIVGDTNELQGDWANGGRLDLILDIIAADTTTDIPTLINALNDLSTTQVNAEVDTALSDFFTSAAALVDSIWDEVLTGATHNVNNSSGKRLRQVDAAFTVHAGTAQAGTATTITLDTGADATDNIYNGDRVIIIGGTGAEEHGIIVSYNGTTKVATMAEAWIITPDNTSEFELTPATVDIETWQHSVVTASANGLPDVNVNEVGDTAQTAGDLAALITSVKADTSAVLVDTAAMQPKVDKIPLSDGIVSWNATALAAINAEADTALTDYDGPTNAEMELRTPTAAELQYIVDHAKTAKPVTFAGGGSTTTAVFINVDGVAASSTDDAYNGRLLVFNAGTLNVQVTDITAYVGATKTATVTAVTTAIGASHTAILV